MSDERLASRWFIVLSWFLVVIAIITMVPVAAYLVVLATPTQANAATTSSDSDIIFVRAADSNNPNPYLVRIDTSGTELPVSGTSVSQTMPDISPDGSRLVYVGQTADGGTSLVTIGSDGSGPVTTLLQAGPGVLTQPRWSPDGLWIAYLDITHLDPIAGNFDLMKIRADGSGQPIKIISATGPEGGIGWSPDSQRLAFSSELDDPITSSQIHLDIVDADGSNYHQTAVNPTSFIQMDPVWAPDQKTIVVTDGPYGSSISCLVSKTNFTDSDAVMSQFNHGRLAGRNPRLSQDGSEVVYATPWTGLLHSIATDASTTVPISTRNNPGETALFPILVPPLSKSPIPSVTIAPPSPHDAFLTRAITVNLDKANVTSYQYGWSESSTTPPVPPYQTSINVGTNRGYLNYRSTTPNHDWYLWIRTVRQDLSTSAWSVPVRVQTPARPIWVGLGDSYSSGHHQNGDSPLCPRLGDALSNLVGAAFALGCNHGTGPVGLIPNSPSFSWVTRAVNQFNTRARVPDAWRVAPDVLATSGASTGAMMTSQLTAMKQDLLQRGNSWNFVSLTGGADDASFSSALAKFYAQHWTGIMAPWAVNTVANCPDTQSVYARAVSAQASIRSNLSAIVTQAVSASPGVQILNVGYAYAVDRANPCFANHGKAAGVKTLIDLLNADHQAITGLNLHYVNLTAGSSFGVNPITSGYIQTTRLYGYPHPSDSGQNLIASTAVGLARSTS